jgi:hypothetical protein
LAANDTVLSQNAVSDVFELRHNSNPRALAPFNESHLAVHCSHLFCYLPLNPLSVKATTVPRQSGVNRECT